MIERFTATLALSARDGARRPTSLASTSSLGEIRLGPLRPRDVFALLVLPGMWSSQRYELGPSRRVEVHAVDLVADLVRQNVRQVHVVGVPHDIRHDADVIRRETSPRSGYNSTLS